MSFKTVFFSLIISFVSFFTYASEGEPKNFATLYKTWSTELSSSSGEFLSKKLHEAFYVLIKDSKKDLYIDFNNHEVIQLWFMLRLEDFKGKLEGLSAFDFQYLISILSEIYTQIIATLAISSLEADEKDKEDKDQAQKIRQLTQNLFNAAKDLRSEYLDQISEHILKVFNEYYNEKMLEASNTEGAEELLKITEEDLKIFQTNDKEQE